MIDPSRLPNRVMLDTNILYFVFDQPTGRAHEVPSKALWDALVRHKKEILIAAPTLAEFLRHGGAAPAVHNVEYIAFDARAAQLVAAALPLPAMKKSQQQSGVTKAAMKFDTLIMGCAARGRADALITYDADFTALKANSVGATFGKLRILSPNDFLVVPLAQGQSVAAAPVAQLTPGSVAD
ncbi:PIN domain-containing protein [Myxococcus sp. SDU36]|uniref:PIN domain-containing protein n=1 Tax=Myxococcus sp. SDU36 TaxID=2831967 RepID=UPI002542E464|nr:PIN domain-containing protein [Myxococcus sp. SDU36]WIG92731.1 PIN domain-containing protein [Myxococcus sp. SDU36]